MNIKSQKVRARLQAKQARLAAQDLMAGPELIRHFPAARFKGDVIAGFWPLRDEIDTKPLLFALHNMGHEIALPCTARVCHPLMMRAWHPGDKLKTGPFHTREPFPHQPEIRPSVLLVPLLAFTKNGDRLGYGGGFYDRTISCLREKGNIFTCGVAFAGQEAASLPVGPFDQELDAVLTDKYFKDF